MKALRNGAIVAVIVLAIAGALRLYVQYRGEPRAPTAEEPRLAPEALVQFQENAYACLSEELFKEAIGRAVMKERTKFGALFDQADCVMLQPSETFRVLHIEGNVIEVANVNSESTNGVWTAPEFIAQLGPKAAQ